MTTRTPPTSSRLATWTFAAVLCGIACGVVFGEWCAVLRPVGDVFVDLLQMTVLPYVVLAIAIGVGQQPRSELRRTYGAALKVIVSMWCLGAVLIVALPWALPTWRAGSFFSHEALSSPEELGLLARFITPNVFNALASGTIPAVVVFSMAFGLAISEVTDRDALLRPGRAARRALEVLNVAILRAVPIGVFAITASTAGTIRFDALARLQGYFIVMTLGTAVLVFVLLPMLVAATTPLSYGAVLRASRPVVLTAFVTGKVLIVLPIVMEAARQLLEEQGLSDDDTEATIDSVVPSVYALPHLGRLMAVSFVPFAAWFVGRPLALADYPALLASGFIAMFGNAAVAIPYLLDADRLPADLFQLFVASSVVCGRLSDAVGAMYFLVVGLLTPCLLSGRVSFRPRRLVPPLLVGLACLCVAMVATNRYVAFTMEGIERPGDALRRMRSLVTDRDAVVHLEVPEGEPSRVPGVERIRRDGVLRVGYLGDNLPFSFFNEDGDLVGHDVDLAHLLAEDLDVELEFVPFEPDRLHEQLDRGDFDLAASGIAVTPTRLLRMSFSESYFDATLAFVVRDHLRDEFSSRRSIERLGAVRIAVARSNYFVGRLRAWLPNAVVEPIDSPREFFEGDEYDALLASAEAGSAWTIEFPDFATVVPVGERFVQPLALAVPLGDDRMVELTDRWVELYRKHADSERLHAHWIEGRDETRQRRRWSVVHDVLGWADGEDSLPSEQ